MQTVFGILLPFLGTTAGAASVFFFKKQAGAVLQKMMFGFASGVMIAASVWSLLLPAIAMSSALGHFAFLPAALGFSAGILFLYGMDCWIPRLQMKKREKTTMLVLAVTLHNIPEGMAVGVAFAGLIYGSHAVSIAGAYALAIGIAVQNFPEGAIVSLPILGEGHTRKRAFLYGWLSGAVEPIAAVFTIALTGLIQLLLPYLLAFAAGAMIYVVVEELQPEAALGEKTIVNTFGFAAGFLVMMILDVALG